MLTNLQQEQLLQHLLARGETEDDAKAAIELFLVLSDATRTAQVAEAEFTQIPTAYAVVLTVAYGSLMGLVVRPRTEPQGDGAE